jgi:hypothetical protein
MRPTHVETANLLNYASKSFEKRIKEVGAALETYYEQACKPLGYKRGAARVGKVAVYLIPERESLPYQFRAPAGDCPSLKLQPTRHRPKKNRPSVLPAGEDADRPNPFENHKLE